MSKKKLMQNMKVYGLSFLMVAAALFCVGVFDENIKVVNAETNAISATPVTEGVSGYPSEISTKEAASQSDYQYELINGLFTEHSSWISLKNNMYVDQYLNENQITVNGEQLNNYIRENFSFTSSLSPETVRMIFNGAYEVSEGSGQYKVENPKIRFYRYLIDVNYDEQKLGIGGIETVSELRDYHMYIYLDVSEEFISIANQNGVYVATPYVFGGLIENRRLLGGIDETEGVYESKTVTPGENTFSPSTKYFSNSGWYVDGDATRYKPGAFYSSVERNCVVHFEN